MAQKFILNVNGKAHTVDADMTSMGPACALVEIKDGDVTCWSGTQKSHFLRQGLALALNVPLDKCE
jgi:hypothetical protein